MSVVVNGQLVSVGSSVQVPLVSGEVRHGVLLAWDGPSVVLLDDAGAVVTLPPVGPLVAIEGPSEGLVDRLAAAAASEASSRSAEAARHQAWVDDLVFAAHKAGDDHAWCSEFDDTLEALGLPRRERDYEVAVEVTTTVYLTVRAAGCCAAEESVQEEAVRDELRRMVDDLALDFSCNAD